MTAQEALFGRIKVCVLAIISPPGTGTSPMRFSVLAALVSHNYEPDKLFTQSVLRAYDCEGREFDGDFNPAGVQ